METGHIPVFTKADRIRKARDFAGLSQAELAQRLGVARSSITNYEKGHHTPLPTIMRQLALATGVRLHWIETGEAPPGGPEGAEVAGAGFEPATSGYQAPAIHFRLAA